MATPVIKALPAAPTRSDGADDFAAKADTFVAALPPLVVQINSTSEWIGGQVAAVEGYKTAAAGSASAAADSASAANASKNAAAQSAIDATANGAAQVGLAVDAKNQAQIAAAAAGAAAGLPSLVGKGRKVLRVRQDVTGVEWGDVREIGDMFTTARNPGSLYLQASGGVYLRSSYPVLAALLPNIGNPAGKVWTTTADATGNATHGIGTDGKGVWIKGNRRSTDNGLTFPTTVTGLGSPGAILSDGNQTWIAANSSNIYRSIDNGLTFTSVHSFYPYTPTNNLLATDGAGTWILSAYSNLMRISKDNGATWSTIASFAGGSTPAVCFIGNNTWIASSGHRSTDGGLTWSAYGTAAGQPMAGAQSLYLGGNVILNLAYTALRRSTDGGFSWTSVASISSNGTCYGLATDGNGGIVALVSTGAMYSSDYGLTWQTLIMPAGYTSINFVAFGMGKFIITVGATGYNSSVETFDYDTGAQFKLPTPQAIPGMKHYIKAKDA